MQETADKVPEIFASSMEEVQRMFLKYEQSKANEN
jgi:hypothetical protein